MITNCVGCKSTLYIRMYPDKSRDFDFRCPDCSAENNVRLIGTYTRDPIDWIKMGCDFDRLDKIITDSSVIDDEDYDNEFFM